MTLCLAYRVVPLAMAARLQTSHRNRCCQSRGLNNKAKLTAAQFWEGVPAGRPGPLGHCPYRPQKQWECVRWGSASTRLQPIVRPRIER